MCMLMGFGSSIFFRLAGIQAGARAGIIERAQMQALLQRLRKQFETEGKSTKVSAKAARPTLPEASTELLKCRIRQGISASSCAHNHTTSGLIVNSAPIAPWSQPQSLAPKPN